MGLMETKRESIDGFLMRRLWSNLNFGFHFVPSMGQSVGLCLIRNSRLVVNHSVMNGSQWIAISFVWNSFNVQLVFVYASNSAADRLQLWEELQPVILFDGAFLILGDFNKITSSEERINCDSFSASMN